MEIFILKNVLRLVLNILNLVKIFSFEVLVIAIFYLANGTSNQWTHLGDLGPFWSYFVELSENELILFSCPVFSNNIWV